MQAPRNEASPTSRKKRTKLLLLSALYTLMANDTSLVFRISGRSCWISLKIQTLTDSINEWFFGYLFTSLIIYFIYFYLFVYLTMLN